MVLETIASGGTLRNYQVQNSTKSIGLKFADTLTNIIAGLDTCYITLKRNSAKIGEKQLIPRMKLKDCLEILGFKTGFVVDDNGTVRTNIDVTFAGALQCNTADFLSLTLENVPAATTVMAIGDSKATNDHLKITPHTVNANGSGKLAVNGAEALFVDTSTLTEIQLICGLNTFSLDAESVQNNSSDFKPSAFMEGGAFKSAHNRYHMILLDGVDAVNIQTTASATVYFLKEKSYEQ